MRSTSGKVDLESGEQFPLDFLAHILDIAGINLEEMFPLQALLMRLLRGYWLLKALDVGEIGLIKNSLDES